MEYWTALILGLAGSLHCAGMCGPLALALPVSGRGRSGFLLGRLAYHLGRILTYGLIGVVFGLVGKTLVLAGFQRWVSIALGVALLIGLFLSRKTVPGLPLTRFVDQLKAGMALLLRRRSLTALVVLGLLNGLLPCGLVYVAAAGATATAGALGGAQYMLVFGLGTVPMMLAISLSRSWMPAALRLKLRMLVPVSVGLVAGLLILRGLSLGIPYLSPNLSSSGHCPACHSTSDPAQ